MRTIQRLTGKVSTRARPGSIGRGLLAAALAGLGLGALSGCSARQKPSSIETRLANAAKDVVIPLEARSARNPTPATALTLARGRQAYEAHCALCHSSDGHSQSPLGLAMYPPAMDLTSPHVQAWTDAELYWIVQNGIRLTGMPSWQGILTPEETWELARYIHALPQMTPQRETALDAMLAPPEPAKAAAPEAAAAYGRRLLHQEGCLNCHRYNDEGADVGPDLTHEARRGRNAAWLAGHFRDPEAYSKDSMMPAFRNLTPGQLQALVALLQNSH